MQRTDGLSGALIILPNTTEGAGRGEKDRSSTTGNVRKMHWELNPRFNSAVEKNSVVEMNQDDRRHKAEEGGLDIVLGAGVHKHSMELFYSADMFSWLVKSAEQIRINSTY